MKVPRYECLRCGHRWIGRLETKPVRCPRCQSPYYDRPRQQPQKRDWDKPRRDNKEEK